MQAAVNGYFAGVESDRWARLVHLLRAAGARAWGPRSAEPRLPMEVLAAQHAALDYTDAITVHGDGWRATVSSSPQWSIAFRWPDAAPHTRMATSSIFDKLTKLQDLDFAVDETDELDNERAHYTFALTSAGYAVNGPVALGVRTLLSPRLLALLDATTRAALEHEATEARVPSGGLVVGDASWATARGRAEQARANEAFVQSPLAARLVLEFGAYALAPGRAWTEIPDAPLPKRPADPTRALARLQEAERSRGRHVEHIQLPGLVAPFARLADLDAEDVELEGAKLPFASFGGSAFVEAGFIGADLRGAAAAASIWIECSFAEADARWADFSAAKCRVCTFDDADLRDADFRGADLIGSTFERANLAGARFAGANLQGTFFRGAKLDGADFTGADFTGAGLTDAIFDPGKHPAGAR